MIVVESGRRDERAFDACVLMASALASRGHDVAISDTMLPERLERSQKYDAAPYLRTVAPGVARQVLLIGADDISADSLIALRAICEGGAPEIAAIGRFADHQALVHAQSRIAYALGREPRVVDLNEFQRRPLLGHSVAPPAAIDLGPSEPGITPRLFVFLPPEWLDDPMTLPMLGAMDAMPGFRLNTLIAGKGKDLIRRSRFSGLSVFGYAELLPNDLAAHCDIAVFFGDAVPGERMAALALNLMASGRVVVDGTTTAAFAGSAAPAVRGPVDLAALPAFLEAAILPNRSVLGAQSKEDRWLRSQTLERLEQALGLQVSGAPSLVEPARTVFVPTNGNGLGHARRCSLIAEHVPDACFAAFPSCVPLLEEAGFGVRPLVSRSPDHPEEHAADLVNYLRLRRLLGPGDRLVFDGGYVFDSVFRAIVEHRLDATWIRRGLWRPGHLTETALEREKAFARVIVPGEAFEELNDRYSFGTSIHPVGPIVGDPSGPRDALRAALRDRLGGWEGRIAVTMVGSGVASDRSAVVQFLSALFDRRDDIRHLVVAWPGATVQAEYFRWRNTQVVRTRSALDLALAADLVVSAAGYNSFHELIYHGIPAIFVPQDAPFMDDQDRRARAASDRGLGVTVAGRELLELERVVLSMLDGGRAADLAAALAAAELPGRGTARAAALIRGEA